MAKVKYEKLKNSWGVSGYRLGEYYLMKEYNRGEKYSWVINTTGEQYLSYAEHCSAVRRGDVVETVRSCKEGQERLVELYLQDVNYTGVNNKKEAV